MVTLVDVLPNSDRAEVVVPAPNAGPGNWSGAPSAAYVDGTFWLAYRVRQPITEGRGVAVAGRSALRDRRRRAPGDLRRRVARAPRDRGAAGRHLAAVRLVCDAGQ